MVHVVCHEFQEGVFNVKNRVHLATGHVVGAVSSSGLSREWPRVLGMNLGIPSKETILWMDELLHHSRGPGMTIPL